MRRATALLYINYAYLHRKNEGVSGTVCSFIYVYPCSQLRAEYYLFNAMFCFLLCAAGPSECGHYKQPLNCKTHYLYYKKPKTTFFKGWVRSKVTTLKSYQIRGCNSCDDFSGDDAFFYIYFSRYQS